MSHDPVTLNMDLTLSFFTQLFLLNVERGDVQYTANLLKAMGKKKNILDIDCQDPLGRSALVISIENESLEMMQLLLEQGIQIKVGSEQQFSARHLCEPFSRNTLSL